MGSDDKSCDHSRQRHPVLSLDYRWQTIATGYRQANMKNASTRKVPQPLPRRDAQPSLSKKGVTSTRKTNFWLLFCLVAIFVGAVCAIFFRKPKYIQVKADSPSAVSTA